jgi:hypothetical protein
MKQVVHFFGSRCLTAIQRIPILLVGLLLGVMVFFPTIGFGDDATAVESSEDPPEESTPTDDPPPKQPLMVFGFNTSYTQTVNLLVFKKQQQFGLQLGIFLELYLPIPHIHAEIGIQLGYTHYRFDGLQYQFAHENTRLQFITANLPLLIKPYFHLNRWRFSFPTGMNFRLPFLSKLSINFAEWKFQKQLQHIYFSPTTGFEVQRPLNKSIVIYFGARYEMDFRYFTSEQIFKLRFNHRVQIFFGMEYARITKD